MAMDGAIVGGSYELRDQGRLAAPIFRFHAPDLARAEAVLKDMYVELEVRFDRAGKLVYQLGVPDRRLEPAAIEVHERDIPRIAAGAAALGTCATLLVDDEGRTCSLDRFCVDLDHDWTRNYATGLRAFEAGELEAAAAPLQFLVDTAARTPAVHHLLGRCHRARGDLHTAVHHWLGAVRNACARGDDRLLPAAAGPLADMGLAFKKLGMNGKASHCLLHSLQLRPNHPEALLAFATLFPRTEALVLYVLGRVVALGGHDSLVEQLVAALAGERPAAELRRQIDEAATRVDLSVWPLARPDLERYASFHAGLERLGQLTPSTGELSAAQQAPTGSFAVLRPWWKFWA